MKTAMSVLRDQIWQFAGALLALITLGVTVYLFFFGQQFKALQVVILANTSLVEVEQSIAQNIKISYKGDDISNLSLVQLKLENIGSKAVLETDYVRPIKFSFPAQSKIIEASITESNPPNVGMSIQSNQNIATLSQVLLNPKDRVIIRFLIANTPTQNSNIPFDIDARIVEVQRISTTTAIAEPTQQINTNNILNIIVVICGVLALLVMMYGGFSFMTSQGAKPAVDRARMITIFGIVVVTLLAVAVAIVNILRA